MNLTRYFGPVAAASNEQASGAMATAAEGSDTLARVSRMRTLSALLDDELADDAALPEAALALLAPPAADAPADAEDAALAEQLAQSRAGAFECVECRAHAAELFCEQCHDYFCELCAGGQHRKGNRRAHTFQPCAAPPAAAAAAQHDDDDDVDGSAPAKDAVDYEVRPVYIYMCLCVYVCVNVSVCANVYMYVPMYLCICVYMCQWVV